MHDFTYHYTDAEKHFRWRPAAQKLIKESRIDFLQYPLARKPRQFSTQLRISEPRFECSLRGPGGIALCTTCLSQLYHIPLIRYLLNVVSHVENRTTLGIIVSATGVVHIYLGHPVHTACTEKNFNKRPCDRIFCSI